VSARAVTGFHLCVPCVAGIHIQPLPTPLFGLSQSNVKSGWPQLRDATGSNAHTHMFVMVWFGLFWQSADGARIQGLNESSFATAEDSDRNDSLPKLKQWQALPNLLTTRSTSD